MQRIHDPHPDHTGRYAHHHRRTKRQQKEEKCLPEQGPALLPFVCPQPEQHFITPPVLRQIRQHLKRQDRQRHQQKYRRHKQRSRHDDGARLVIQLPSILPQEKVAALPRLPSVSIPGHIRIGQFLPERHPVVCPVLQIVRHRKQHLFHGSYRFIRHHRKKVSPAKGRIFLRIPPKPVSLPSFRKRNAAEIRHPHPAVDADDQILVHQRYLLIPQRLDQRIEVSRRHKKIHQSCIPHIF